ncbi:MAG: EAL domain-containing protein [Pseudomonadota bacterium]
MSQAVFQDQVPQQLKFAEQRRLLSRVALSISLILALYLCIISIIMPVMTIGKAIAAIAALLIGSLSWLCHHEKLYTASAATIVAITIIGGFVASLSNGGADGFVAPIMISAPVTAAVFIGARATLISAIAVVLAIISLLYLEQIGLVTEAPYSQQALDIAAIVMLSASTAICATGVGYFAHAMQTQIHSMRQAQERLMQVSEQLDHSAHHDSLTGVANRKGLNRHLDQLLAGGSKSDTLICLAHIDLDRFKSINDTYGHPVGDEVLKNTADIMRDAFYDGALVARVGGDEFVIVSLLPVNMPAEQVQTQCDRLIARLRAPMVANGIVCEIGASIGFVATDRRACSIETLMSDADLALYEAKREGRGQARAFRAEMRSQIEQDRVFRMEIEQALEEERVSCILQPQVSLHTGRVIGVEGLGRIRCQSGDLLPPALILPILTEIGRLTEFDLQVMRCSLSALCDLRAAGAVIPYISINASSQSLRSSVYVSGLVDALESHGLTSADVVVEILESTLIEGRDDKALTSIDQLRAAGIQTIMDDFGSGHATISNLLNLELDGLKIDRSLIANIENKMTLEIVRAIHDLALKLDLTVIVEGVETPQQFALLRSIGCEKVQGFGICKPLEPEAIGAWIKAYGTSPVAHLQDRILDQSRA